MLDQKKFLILNFVRSEAFGYLQFWNQNLHGYTNDLSQAGVFTETKKMILLK